jgi:phosphohistidine phosphatase
MPVRSPARMQNGMIRVPGSEPCSEHVPKLIPLLTPMKRLYLLRHAKSSHSAGFDADHERPLAPRGVEATERLTRYLQKAGASPDVVLCSSARRTRETLEGISPGLAGDPELTIEQSLYCASSWQLLERVRRLPAGASAAMVIGHNPGLHDLAIELAGAEGRARLAAFPPGALLTLDLEGDAWTSIGESTCTVADYVVPKGLS